MDWIIMHAHGWYTLGGIYTRQVYTQAWASRSLIHIPAEHNTGFNIIIKSLFKAVFDIDPKFCWKKKVFMFKVP